MRENDTGMRVTYEAFAVSARSAVTLKINRKGSEERRESQRDDLVHFFNPLADSAHQF